MFKSISDRLNKYLYFVNDTKDVDEQKALDNIKKNNQFSTSYILLLFSSAIIATLGLLQNSGPIIIGGMIISPLMWPLLSISSSIAYDRRTMLKKSIALLLVSVSVSILTSVLITYVTPLDTLNDQILSRTNPILPDILVALAGGLIASYGLLHSRISQGLAGVAIATSLMPPLCVVGIGLATLQIDITSGAFILFLTNCVAIIFISIIIFILYNIRKDDIPELVGKRSFIFITIILILLAVPLYIFMQEYIYDQNIAKQVDIALVESLKESGKNVEVKNIRIIESSESSDTMYITADIISNNNFNLTFSDEQVIKTAIKNKLDTDKIIELRLTNQNFLNILSEDEIIENNLISKIKESSALAITNFSNSIIIDQIEVSKNEDSINVNATVFINPQNNIDFNDVADIDQNIDIISDEDIELQLTVLPLVVINEADNTQTDEEKNIEDAIKKVEEYIADVSQNIDINFIEINVDKSTDELKETIESGESILENNPNEQKSYNANIKLTAQDDVNIEPDEILDIIKNELIGDNIININIEIIEKRIITI